jgi:hypothetical protein
MNRNKSWLTDGAFSKIEPHLPTRTRGQSEAALARTASRYGGWRWNLRAIAPISEGWAAKSKVSRLLICVKRAESSLTRETARLNIPPSRSLCPVRVRWRLE